MLVCSRVSYSEVATSLMRPSLLSHSRFSANPDGRIVLLCSARPRSAVFEPVGVSGCVPFVKFLLTIIYLVHVCPLFLHLPVATSSTVYCLAQFLNMGGVPMESAYKLSSSVEWCALEDASGWCVCAMYQVFISIFPS